MSIKRIITVIILFTVTISGCIDNNRGITNISTDSDKNTINISAKNTTASELTENNTTSNDASTSINIVLEKPPKEVIGGE